jgi:cytidine deaminase
MTNPELDPEDHELIQTAVSAIKARYDPDWHVVGAALRLKSGEVVTGVHLEANVGRIAVCAEAVALGRAVSEYGSGEIETIVAVYHPGNGEPFVCSPCGMCRELIADYSPHARILMAEADGRVRTFQISEILPSKYRRSAAQTYVRFGS